MTTGAMFCFALFLVSVIIAACTGNPTQDHIFVFEGEKFTIDCAGGPRKPILQYRKRPDSNLIMYFSGDERREDDAQRFKPRSVGNDYWYDNDGATSTDGGEYDCDWTKQKDELMHYVTVAEKKISCPKAPEIVDAGVAVENLECSISKSGALLNEWLNDETKETGLKFTIEDDHGELMKVEYKETADKITARTVDLKFHAKQNGTALTCKFVSIHNTPVQCETRPIHVQCDKTSDERFCPKPTTKPEPAPEPRDNGANSVKRSITILGLTALIFSFRALA